MAKKQVKINPPPDASFPLSSMIDVVFLLLIFFLVTQKPITEEVPMNVELPAPDLNSNPEDAPTLITIEVGKNPGDRIKDGVEELYYLFNNREMEIKTIREHLKNFREANASKDKKSSPTIIITCAANVRFYKLIRLLDMCNEFEMDSLQLVNKPNSKMDPEVDSD